MSEDSKFGADPPGTITIPEVTIQPYPTIKLGSRGPTVAKWQRMIGVDPDGNFGKVTDAKTRAFQSSKGLTADGIVGIKTWAAALEKTSPTGMLALEWNQPSPEIPAPPASPAVIPPVQGAVPLPGVPVSTAAATVAAAKAADVLQPKTMKAGMGFFDWIGGLPGWAKVLGLIGIAGGAVASSKKVKR